MRDLSSQLRFVIRRSWMIEHLNYNNHNLFLLSPNFIPNFGKIRGAVLEICRYARTDARTDGGDIIGPAVFNLGPIIGNIYNYCAKMVKMPENDVILTSK